MHWIVTLCFLCASIIILCANTNSSNEVIRKKTISSKRLTVATKKFSRKKKISENIKDHIPLEHYLIQKLQNETSARQHAEDLCASYEESLWIATARTIMDDFEDTHAYSSVVDRKAIPAGISYHGRTRLVRKMQLLWIINNRSNEYDVQYLIQKIERSVERKEFNSMDEFADAYASLYSELSKTLKTRLLHPKRGVFNFSHLFLNKSANKAMMVFMSIFDLPKFTDMEALKENQRKTEPLSK